MKIRFLLIGVISMFFAGLLTTSSYAKIDPKTCVGMWLFDEGSGKTAKDFSGNGNDGTLMSNPKWVDGKFGKALEFDGVASYVELPQLPGQTNQSLSFVAWIKWGGTTATTRGVWGYTNVATINCHFEIQTAGMRLRLGDINKTGMTSPPANQWASVGFTYDGSTARYYLNGTEIGNFSGNTGAIFGAESALGHIVGVSDAGRFFDGLIDEAAFFGVALAVQDIQTITNNGLKQSLGIAAVDLSGKLTTTWAFIKAR
ncbi:MAG: LamG domain-containing protein [Candidatus Poribacteria bacterium]